MALVGTPSGVAGQGQAPASEAVKDNAEFKAAKKAAADRHRAKVIAQRQKDHEDALAEKDWLTKEGLWDKAPADVKNSILARCTPPTERTGHQGPSFFTQLFGAKPAINQSITLKDVIAKTYKGMDTMNASIKKWSQKGIEVKTEINKQNMLETKYTITALPTA